MVVRDRNHPSLIGYTLQNEQVSEAPTDEGVRAAMDLVRALDPTRIIVLQSGFQGREEDIPAPMRRYANGQAFFLPGDTNYYHDGGGGWCGWFDHHTVGGPGLYQDWLYEGPDGYSHASARNDEIVFWGETLGAGSIDNLAAIAAFYTAHPRAGGYHKATHLGLIAALEP
jgi:beta-galactosidase